MSNLKIFLNKDNVVRCLILNYVKNVWKSNFHLIINSFSSFKENV